MKKKIESIKKTNTMTPSWYLDVQGVLFVSGEGRMEEYPCTGESTAPPWDAIKDHIETLYVGEGITWLGSNAFMDCRNLKKVILPSTLEGINSACFKNCTSLTEVIAAPEKEFRVIHEMLDRKKAKKEVASYKKGGVLSDIFFGLNAFYEVPWAIEKWGDFYIHDHVLAACFHAEDHVKIPDGVKSIDTFAFQDRDFSSVEFPDSLKKIKSFAFNGTKLKRVVFPENLEEVDRFAFVDAPLELVLLPHGAVKNIHNKAFHGTKLPDGWYVNKPNRIPEAYKLASVDDLIGDAEYKKLCIQEKPHDVHEKPVNQVTTKALSAGHSIMRRLYRFMLVLGIQYDENTKTVQSVKSYRYYKLNEDEYTIHETILTPGYKDVDGEREVQIENLERKNVTKEEVREKYFIRHVPDGIVNTNYLAVPQDGICEEWYCSQSKYYMTIEQEKEFLELWLSKHPDYQLKTL